MPRCRFFDLCPIKQIGQITCESQMRIENYYGADRPAGCYRKMEDLEHEMEARYGNARHGSH